MSSLGIFTQACQYTLDPTLQATLENCAKGKYPPHFKILKGKVITVKGNTFELSRDPMDICNLVHDIMNGQEKSPKSAQQGLTLEQSRRSSRPSRSAGSTVGVSDDAIYSFARRETLRLQKDEHHKGELLSCIFTAIMLGDISALDFVLKEDRIISINGINTEHPCIELIK